MSHSFQTTCLSFTATLKDLTFKQQMNRKKKSIKVLFILNIGSGNDAILLIHKSPTYHTVFLPASGKVCFRIRNTGIWNPGIWNPGIRNSTQGIQNPAIDNHELWETCFPWLSYICRTLRAVFMLICSRFISRLYFSGFQKNIISHPYR